MRAIAAPFIFGTATVMFLFLFQFLMKHLNKLLGKGIDTIVILQLIALNLAWMLVMAVPIGVLFATIMGFGSLSAANETTVIKASGGSLLKMMRPVIIMGILLTYALFWFNDVILPDTNHQAKVLFSDIKRRKPTFAIEAGQFSTQLDGYTILARRTDSLTGKLFALTIYDNRKSRSLNVVSADSGEIKFNADMTGLDMQLYHGEIHRMTPSEVKGYRKVNFEEYTISTDARGFDFNRTEDDVISRGDREMHISDMRLISDEARRKFNNLDSIGNIAYDKHFAFLNGSDMIGDSGKVFENEMPADTSVESALYAVKNRLAFLRTTLNSNRLRKNDYAAKERKYLVEIYKKYSIPFAVIVFLLVGCPLGVATRKGNFGVSAGISLGFFIFYWAFLIGGEKLADRGFLPPGLSMWLGNIIIGLIGVYLTIKVNNESITMPGAKYVRGLLKKRRSKKEEIVIVPE